MPLMKVVMMFFALVLCGCNGPAVLKANLKPAVVPNVIYLDRNVTYKAKRGIGVYWTEGLLAGTYKPELQNEYGTFYRGNGKCVTQFMEKTEIGPFEGGIWLPNDYSKYKPILYYYFDSKYGYADAGLVVGAIIEAGKGKLTFVPSAIEDQEFLKSISVSSTEK